MELTCFISLKHVAIVMYEYKSTSLLLLGTHFIVITLYYQPYEKGRGYTDRPTQGDFFFTKKNINS